MEFALARWLALGGALLLGALSMTVFAPLLYNASIPYTLTLYPYTSLRRIIHARPPIPIHQYPRRQPLGTRRDKAGAR